MSYSSEDYNPGDQSIVWGELNGVNDARTGNEALVSMQVCLTSYNFKFAHIQTLASSH